MEKTENSKYADFLTILLVLVIVGIIGLLGFFGYKAVSKHNVETEAAQAVEEFYKNIDSSSTEEDSENEAGEEEQAEEDMVMAPIVPGLETPSVEQQTPAKAVTKTYLGEYEIKGTIKIPKTGIEYPILNKASVGALAKSIGMMEVVTCDTMTTMVDDLNIPGTNAYILGHNYRNGQFFSNNDRLTIGDSIEITDQRGEKVIYYIYKTYYTTPDDVSFMQRELNSDVREISLQTCNSDSSQRLIIWAKDV